MEKIVFLLTVGLCALSAPAWDVEHDEVAQLTGEFLPREVQAWFSFADFGVLLASCHTPDLIEWPMEGGVRRYRNAAEIVAMTSPAALAAFRSCGFADTANWFHKPNSRGHTLQMPCKTGLSWGVSPHWPNGARKKVKLFANLFTL